MKKSILKYISIAFLVMFSINKVVYAIPESSFQCSNLGDLRKDLQNFFNFFKFLAPLLVIGLSTVDFIKAISDKDDKDIKKAFTRLMKRMVCAVILFFLPVLLDLFLELLINNVDICIS